MGQDIFDTAIILLLAFFTIRGWLNGFVGEIAAIVSLIGGFWAAHTFHKDLAPQLTFVSDPLWQNMGAYIIIFVAVIIAVAVVAKLFQRILSFAFIAWADRVFGAMLGLAKGLILCTIAFVVINKFFATAEFFQQSRVRPYFASFIEQVRTHLPPDVVKRFSL
ncbi:MAG: CvpA family protein [Desulfovibrio sp.]|jgi:membrane protein required for colicin V production|nr:CvpA family protein [Desulfovibrio sp.]